MSLVDFKRIIVSYMERANAPVLEKTLIDICFAVCDASGRDMSEKLMYGIEIEQAIDSLVSDNIIRLNTLRLNESSDSVSWEKVREYHLVPKLTEANPLHQFIQIVHLEMQVRCDYEMGYVPMQDVQCICNIVLDVWQHVPIQSLSGEIVTMDDVLKALKGDSK